MVYYDRLHYSILETETLISQHLQDEIPYCLSHSKLSAGPTTCFPLTLSSDIICWQTKRHIYIHICMYIYRYGMFSSSSFPMGSCLECSRGGPNGPPLGPHGRALVRPLGLHGQGPCGLPGPLWARHLWASLGPLRAPLGPCGSGTCGAPWALMGQALVGALMGRPHSGPLGL